jgi:hypothetical protein
MYSWVHAEKMQLQSSTTACAAVTALVGKMAALTSASHIKAGDDELIQSLLEFNGAAQECKHALAAELNSSLGLTRKTEAPSPQGTLGAIQDGEADGVRLMPREVLDELLTQWQRVTSSTLPQTLQPTTRVIKHFWAGFSSNPPTVTPFGLSEVRTVASSKQRKVGEKTTQEHLLDLLQGQHLLKEVVPVKDIFDMLTRVYVLGLAMSQASAFVVTGEQVQQAKVMHQSVGMCEWCDSTTRTSMMPRAADRRLCRCHRYGGTAAVTGQPEDQVLFGGTCSIVHQLYSLVVERATAMDVKEVEKAMAATLSDLGQKLREGYLLPYALRASIRDTRVDWMPDPARIYESRAAGSSVKATTSVVASQDPDGLPEGGAAPSGTGSKLCPHFNSGGCRAGTVKECKAGRHCCSYKVADASRPGHHRICGDYGHGRSSCPKAANKETVIKKRKGRP